MSSWEQSRGVNWIYNNLYIYSIPSIIIYPSFTINLDSYTIDEFLDQKDIPIYHQIKYTMDLWFVETHIFQDVHQPFWELFFGDTGTSMTVNSSGKKILCFSETIFASRVPMTDLQGIWPDFSWDFFLGDFSWDLYPIDWCSQNWVFLLLVNDTTKMAYPMGLLMETICFVDGKWDH